MTHPVLVLRPPERRGRAIALSADLLVGSDVLTLSALLGPDTQAWLRRSGRQALHWSAERLDEVRKLLRRYVRLEGDWSRFAELGAAAFETARIVAGSTELRPASDDARAAAATFVRLSQPGPEGDQARDAVRRIMAASMQGEPLALAARHMLEACRMASLAARGQAPLSHHPMVLEACRALGYAIGKAGGKGGSSEPLTVGYDAEEALLLPAVTPKKLACLCGSALDFQGYGRIGTAMPLEQAVATLRHLCR